MTVRLLVVDDESVARRGVRKLLAGDPELEIVGEASSGREAVEAIRRLRPDVVLLDIQMPEMDGLEVVRELGGDPAPVVVFLTAYDQHALRAFEVNALDYVLKPFDDERFAAAIERAKRQVRRIRDGDFGARISSVLAEMDRGPAPRAPVEAGAGHLDRILVPAGDRILVVRVEEVDWIEAADYYARLHVGGRAHLVRRSLSELESQLDPRRFVRIHRSAIVAVDRIREVLPLFGGTYTVVLSDGTRLRLSRTRRGALERALGQPL